MAIYLAFIFGINPMKKFSMFIRASLLIMVMMFPLASYAILVGYLGVETAASNDGYSIIINQVFPGSPAHQAGLMPGDVITQLNGENLLGNQSGLIGYIQSNPDSVVQLTISRQGYLKTGYVRIGSHFEPDSPPLPDRSSQSQGFGYPNVPQGVTVINNFFGDVSGQKNQTIQSGTGHNASQSNQ